VEEELPLRVVATDLDGAGRVEERFPEYFPNLHLETHSLDVSRPEELVEILSGRKVERIGAHSVFSHLPQGILARAIPQIVSHLAPGGIFSFTVLARETIEQIYTAVPGLSDAFYPKMQDSRGGISDSDHIEYFLPHGRYLEMAPNYCRVTPFTILADNHCDIDGCIYRPFIGKPLWYGVEIQKQ
jgi:hypothetical protein